MKAISIVNPKGGSGKSTLATNLAGYLARQGQRVLLGDIDRQQSCRAWLELRGAALPAIHTWEIGLDDIARPPKGLDHAVLDTPAGLSGKALEKVIKVSAQIIVPVPASAFDLWATRHFLQQLLDAKAVHKGKAEVALVGMRVDPRTIAATQLAQFFEQLGHAPVALLRPTQLYPRVAAEGASVFDVKPSQSLREREDWQPLLRWLTEH